MTIIKNDSSSQNYVWKIGIILLAVVAYYSIPGINEFISTSIEYLKNRNFHGLRTYISSFGIWAPITSIALIVLQSIIPLLPGLALTITNAFLFGWKLGALYSWIGAFIGAIVDFGIARWYGQPVVEKFIDIKHLSKVNQFIIKHGVFFVFVTRLTPLVPFKLVSYGAGLTTIPLTRFMLATGLGQIPAIVMYSIIGDNFSKNVHLVIFISTLLVLTMVILYIYRDRFEAFIASKINSKTK